MSDVSDRLMRKGREWMTAPKLLAVLLALSLPGGDALKVVGLFDNSSAHLKTAFTSAIAHANDQQQSGHLRGVFVDVDQRSSVFRKSEQLCRVLKTGVAAVLALHQTTREDYARSICDAAEIPFIDIGWQNHINGDGLFISLHPNVDTLIRAFYDLVKHWKWTSFVILYEHGQELQKYHEFFTSTVRFRVTFRQLQGTNYHSILREMKDNGETRFILDCETATVKRVLQQAQQLRLTTPDFHYLLTTLDVHAVDLSSFVYDRAKITAFQLIDPGSTTDFNDAPKKRKGNGVSTSTALTTEEALVADTVKLLSVALNKMDSRSLQPYRIDCEAADTWSQGSEVFNAISHTRIEGLTGSVSFDSHGLRSDIYLDIVEVTETGYFNVGEWTSKEGLKFGPPRVLVPISGQVLRAITVVEEPYVMVKKDAEFRTGNDRYEGYAIDLMNRVAEELNFTYILEDKGKIGHGVHNHLTNEWNGLIGELIAKRGDVALGGITISHNREQVIDFTKPFMRLGISILYRKPAAQPPDLFSFLHPFSSDVWVCIFMALILVSGTIFLLARFSPYEWYNPHPCNVHMDIVENQFTIGNSIWFMVGSLFQQGSDVWPRAISTRINAGCWWFFTLIMIASYTANLAAFLAVEQTDQPIKSADDLAKQTEIKYGSYKGGATYNFFKESKHQVYQKIWLAMNEDEKNFVSPGAKVSGIQKVIEEKYAYFMESPSLEYSVNQHCELQQIGGLLDSKGFGFATQLNSPYRDAISKTILRLQENSELERIKDNWWKGKNVVCAGKAQDANSELGLANVGGVFIILLGGIVVSLLVAAAEFIYSVQKITKITQRPFCSEVGQAFTYALKMKGSSPVKLARPSQCAI